MLIKNILYINNIQIYSVKLARINDTIYKILTLQILIFN
jgi:hypothetical protein